ncbi:YqgE/AlgH family protein [Planctomicrobium sp. SH661]|uniref:YqgE/AlgH family protein n=1 Tax=Planctomicrobium sp. SH661 TaxID=3448124 RepID=UPI003F5BB9D0
MSESLRGQILIAGCQLRDSNFFKTAVLIVEDGPDGAMGLVINRPSAVTIAKALTGHLDLPENDDLIYMGGPVEPAALFVVHNSAHLDPEEAAVVPGVYMGSSAEVFEDIVCQCDDTYNPVQYRVYCGCAGWGPGQLAGEMSRGDWLTIPAHPSYIFHPNPYLVWDELLAKKFRSQRILPQTCEHPEWN